MKMKVKIAVGLVLAAIAAGGIGVIKVKYFEAGSFLDINTARLKVDHVARYDAAGQDIRFYVFTPPGPENAHISCGLAAGENNSSLQCWKKNVYAPEPVVGAKD